MRQYEFDHAGTLARIPKLVKALNEVYARMYKEKYHSVYFAMPYQVSYRSFMLARSLLIFELFALLDPDKIVIDPFEALKDRGNFLFQAFIGPTGHITNKQTMNAAVYATTSTNRYTEVHSKAVCDAWVQFQIGLRVFHFMGKQKFSLVDITFMDVWNRVVPEPARSDLERAKQLEWLFKYYRTFFNWPEACICDRE